MEKTNFVNTNVKIEFKCETCNKQYKTQSGLWKHNDTYHKKQEIKPTIKFKCRKCHKEFNSQPTRWRHEEKCLADTTDNKIVKLEQEIDKLKTQITNISDKPKVINNYTQNNNNIVIANPPGSETIDHLTIEQKRFIMNKGLSSLMYLIETTNFNKSTPENHSYCVTAINDKHASMVDTKTNSIIKTDKMELYDKVLAGNLYKLEKLSGDEEFSKKEKLDYIETVERLKNILFLNKKGIKKYYSGINLLSYNNKELVQETWNGLKKLDEMVISNKISSSNIIKENSIKTDFESESDIESDDEVNTKKLIKLRKQFGIKNTKKIIPDFESESGSDDDSDSEPCGLPEITINDKQYILDGTQVYTKSLTGTKAELYGTYVNGKIKKNKQMKEFNL